MHVNMADGNVNNTLIQYYNGYILADAPLNTLAANKSFLLLSDNEGYIY